MPQVSMVKFMQLVNAANSGFTQARSSLNNIILLLGGSNVNATPVRNIPQVTAARIENELITLSTIKLLRYSSALEYLGKSLDIASFARPANCSMSYQGFELQSTIFKGGGKEVKTENGIYLFKLSFSMQSSNTEHQRVLGDRSLCLTRERVWYPGARAHMPPFNALLQNTPADFVAPELGNWTPNCEDFHSTRHPAFIVSWPLQLGGSVTAFQRYQYKSPNREWQDIPQASYKIEKGVRRGKSGKPVFYFSKKNWLEENPTPFHFEVEITIGSEPIIKPIKLPARFGTVHTNIAQQADVNVLANGN